MEYCNAYQLKFPYKNKQIAKIILKLERKGIKFNFNVNLTSMCCYIINNNNNDYYYY